MAAHVYLFLSNIIDYLRLIFVFVSCYYLQHSHVMASTFYLASSVLDHIDGPVARKLHQETRFGHILDQLTDRITTMCLCAALCHFYPQYMLFFQFSMALDIFSHWIYVQSCMLLGQSSHKRLGEVTNPILRHYYNNEIVLFVLCAANDLFFCLLYLTYFMPGPTLPLGSVSVRMGPLFLYLSAPLSLIKSGINVIHVIVACQNIVAVDLAEREKGDNSSGLSSNQCRFVKRRSE